jgi:type IV pilus assembly protein PilM
LWFTSDTGVCGVGFSQRLGWIGVDIGTHTVKLAQVSRDAMGVRLHRAAVIQRSTSWISEDTLALEQPVTSQPEIQAALECGGFAGRDAVCTLPMNVCQLRGLNVPPGTDQERRTMVADVLADDWAEKKVVMEFDFWELDADRAEKSGDSFNVNVLAASRPWISQLWHDCRRCGLNCWGIDGIPLSMARAVSLAGGLGGGKRVLTVDWGFSNATLCVVGDGRPLYSRRVHNCGFGRILDAIMSVFHVNLDEAQHLTDTDGLAPQDNALSTDAEAQAAITDAASETLDELIRQLKRTLQFMESQRRHLQPTALWLMGGGASLRNVAPHLAHAIQLPVHVWALPDPPNACAQRQRGALFSGAAALSALAWRAA